MKKFWLILFYGFANHLPNSYTMLVGKICNRIRISICRHIFKECGIVSIINRNIYFGKGQDIVIGDYSGIGANCVIPSNIIIGKYVMMGPDVYCLQPDHKTDDVNTPMCFQGHTDNIVGGGIIIGDDVWIGARVTITKGRHIGNHLKFRK